MHCGHQPHDETLPCVVCGHFKLGKLSIVTDAGQFPIAIATSVGRQTLKFWIQNEDFQFSANEQYRIAPDSTFGWTIFAFAGTPNPTFVNGAAIDAGIARELRDGDQVTIGAKRARITIRIDRAS